jgi:glycosyltransferase involved in cell wall biosynthesis
MGRVNSLSVDRQSDSFMWLEITPRKFPPAIPEGAPSLMTAVKDTGLIAPAAGPTRESRSAITPGPELSVIVPTRNEHDNVRPVYDGLCRTLQGIDWEAIFVDDDSKDGTPEAVCRLANQDRRVRCIQRIGRRGLASACVEGILASSAPYVAVMDADLQHDERLLPRMLDILKSEPIVDVVVGSRYVEHGSIGTWSRHRAWLSRFATRIGRSIMGVPIADPMSGFFMLRRRRSRNRCATCRPLDLRSCSIFLPHRLGRCR